MIEQEYHKSDYRGYNEKDYPQYFSVICDPGFTKLVN